MFMSKGQKLVQQVHVSSSTTTTTTTTIDEENGNKSDIDTLEYRPWIGFEAGVWWDSLTIVISNHLTTTVSFTTVMQ